MHVRFDGVGKRFRESIALQDVSLQVDSGECLVLLGPSGCGKTTLLRLLAGLESADEGDIFIGDVRVNDLPPAQRDVAMVFQNYALYPHFTVRENIAFPLTARGVPPSEIAPRVLQAAARLELVPLLERRPAALSGGQQQRVALARAIVRNPGVYLMDEPLSNLDAQLRTQTRGELKRLQQELRTTTVYVTHDQGEAMTMGERVAVLRAGRVEQIGAPLELYRSPANRFVAGFLGSPSVNLWPGLLVEGAVGAAGARIPCSPGLRGALTAAFEVAVRPEDVRLSPRAAPGFAEGRVVIAEAMGNETIVTLESAGQRVVARGPGDLDLPAGASAYFLPAPDRILFFDAETGVRVAAMS